MIPKSKPLPFGEGVCMLLPKEVSAQVASGKASPWGEKNWQKSLTFLRMMGEIVGFLALAVGFPLRPLIRPGFAGPPSPEGEGFGAVELGGCRGETTWAAGAASAL